MYLGLRHVSIHKNERIEGKKGENSEPCGVLGAKVFIVRYRQSQGIRQSRLSKMARGR